MKLLKINGKNVDLPESWSDVTWGQAVSWFNAVSAEGVDVGTLPMKAVSIMTGLGESFWREYNGVAEYNVLASEILSWMIDTSKAQNQVGEINARNKLTIKAYGKRVRLPYDLLEIPIGLYEDMKSLAKPLFEEAAKQEEGDESFSLANFMTDTGMIFRLGYQYARDNKKYNYMVARDLPIDDVPYYLVIAWRDFFLSNVIKLSNGTPIN